MLSLNGINFSRVMNAAGARGFYGEGYSYDKIWRLFGKTWEGCGFVAKTMTLEPRAGNMPLKLASASFRPKEFFPKCIVVKPWTGAALNAVGLSNPGANWLLEQQWWQLKREPFFLSFMAVADTALARVDETAKFVDLFNYDLKRFNAPIGLEVNFSCPNVGINHEHPELAMEVEKTLTVLRGLRNVPIICKFSPLMMDFSVLTRCAMASNCAALTIGNTVAWNAMPAETRARYFGCVDSPLAHLGGGGISGPPLYGLVANWLVTCGGTNAVPKPIIACGGIDSAWKARRLFDLGASAIQLGTVSITRPWRMRSIIKAVTP